MLGIFLILIFAGLLIFVPFLYTPRPVKKEEHSAKYNMQMKKLWSVAQTSMKTSKPFRAEKALLTILKFDEKNAAAYNRLGILYAKSQRFDDAIECFEIAQSLDANPSSLHNVGLIYLETGAYEKAEMALTQAIEAEGDIPARYMALAKAEEKLGKRREAIAALEAAYELKADVAVLRQMLAIHEAADDQVAIAATMARIEEQIARESAAKARPRPVKRRVLAPRGQVARTSAAAKPRPRPVKRPAPATTSRRRRIIQ